MRIWIGLGALVVAVGGWFGYRSYARSADRHACDVLEVADDCYRAAVHDYTEGHMSDADSRIASHCRIRARVAGVVPVQNSEATRQSKQMLAILAGTPEEPEKSDSRTVLGAGLYIAGCISDTKQRVQAEALR